jgi:hypothetical protein
MVIDGNAVSKDDFTVAKFEGDRIRLPPRFVEQARFTGGQKIECWLYVVKAGGYRLFTPKTPDPEGEIAELLQRYREIAEPGGPFEGTDNDELAGTRAKIIPCAASPRGPGWRIHIPKKAKVLAVDAPQPKSVFLLIVAGHVEIWFPHALQQAVSKPLSALL